MSWYMYIAVNWRGVCASVRFTTARAREHGNKTTIITVLPVIEDSCHCIAYLFYFIPFLLQKTKMTRILYCLLAIFVSFAAAQNSTNSTTDGWGGCVFPNDPTKSTKVKIGEPTPVCITVGPGGSWAAGVPYIRWVFTPNADQYSYFRIPDCEFINV